MPCSLPSRRFGDSWSVLQLTNLPSAATAFECSLACKHAFDFQCNKHPTAVVYNTYVPLSTPTSFSDQWSPTSEADNAGFVVSWARSSSRLCFRQPMTNVNPTTTTTTNDDDNQQRRQRCQRPTICGRSAVAVPLKLYHFLSVFALQNGICISHKPALKRDVSPWATLHI